MIGNTGAACSMTSLVVSCQTATSARTLSATLAPDGKVALCNQPQGASPGCVLWQNPAFPPGFVTNLEPRIGPFACVPIERFGISSATGAVCTLVATGKGFRIRTGKVSRVSTISKGPHPPCTRGALSAAIERSFHKRSLAPSYLARGWQCVGSFARGDFIDVHGRIADDVTVVFRQARRSWTLGGRGNVCEDGEIPARIWYLSCAVN